MSWRQVWVLFVKEMRETVRDRRTLMAMVGIPVLLYPLLAVGVTQLVQIQMAAIQKQKIRVVAIGDHRGMLAPLLGDARLQHMVSPADGAGSGSGSGSGSASSLPYTAETALAALRAGEIDVLLKVGPTPDDPERLAIGIEYTITEDKSNSARRRVLEMIELINRGHEVRRLHQRELSLRAVSPMRLSVTNVDADQAGGFVFGRMLAMLLVVLAVTFPFHPALDLAAGEKERGTLETLLVSPAGRREIVVGKYLAVVAVGLAASALNLGSMALTFDQVAGMTKGMQQANVSFDARHRAADEALAYGGSDPSTLPAGVVQDLKTLLDAATLEPRKSLDFSLGPLAVLKILMALVPLVALFSAAALALSSLARSYKEGQNYLTPMLVVVMPLSMIVMVPDVDLTVSNAWVPVANVVLLVRDLFIGKLAMWPFVVCIVSTVAFAGLALWAAVAMFEREEVLFREVGAKSMAMRPHKRCEVPPAPTAFLGFALAVIVVALVGPKLQLAVLEHYGSLVEGLQPAFIATIVCNMTLIVAIALAITWWWKASMPQTLALNRVHGGVAAMLLAATIGVGGNLLSLPMTAWLVEQFPGLGEGAEEMQKVMELAFDMPLALTLLLMAVLPGVCEELLFRGAILQSLRKACSARAAVLLTAVMFALVHIQFVRWPATFIAGAIAGTIVLRSASVFAGIAFHVAWNATGILFVTIMMEGAGSGSADAALPLWVAPLGLTLMAAGGFAFASVTRMRESD